MTIENDADLAMTNVPDDRRGTIPLQTSWRDRPPVLAFMRDVARLYGRDGVVRVHAACGPAGAGGARGASRPGRPGAP